MEAEPEGQCSEHCWHGKWFSENDSFLWSRNIDFVEEVACRPLDCLDWSSERNSPWSSSDKSWWPYIATPTELQGTQVRPMSAGAHWQLGKTESHGGWFARVLDRIIEDHQPSSQEEWLECVSHAHIKNQMIQVHGFTPHQFVFGKNPNTPEDLLNEPLTFDDSSSYCILDRSRSRQDTGHENQCTESFDRDAS